MRTDKEIHELIMKVATEDDRIRAVYMHGSRANPNVEPDKYSDYDIAFVVTEINSFINDENWPHNFGDIAFLFEGYLNQNNFFMKEINDLSRRYVYSMLFKDGSHIDLIIEIIDEAMCHIDIKNKPTIRLLDKDGCLPEITQVNSSIANVRKPCEDEYISCCSGFWWFLSYVAKSIARDNFPYAKEQFISYNLLTLNRMMDWYVGMQTNFSLSIDRKYYKKYLPSEIYNLYMNIYSNSEHSNFWNAIFCTCKLFSQIAIIVGQYFGFNYNKQEENGMLDYLDKIKSDTL